MYPQALIEDHFRLNPFQKTALKRLQLITLTDLLYYLPARYAERANSKHIAELVDGDHASVCGKVLKNIITKAYRRKIPIAEVTIEDTTGKIRAIWFHQAYMAKKVPEGGYAKISGLVSTRKSAQSGAASDERYFANPEIEQVESLELTQAGSLFATQNLQITPVYPESRGVSSLWLRHHIQTLLKAKVHEALVDPIPPDILSHYHLPSLKTALVWIHSPRKEADTLSARKRFAFAEIFLIQLARQQARLAYESNPAFTIAPAKHLLEDFKKRFPFKPTSAQERALAHILADFKAHKPMTRLLEGDVGSGKTAVAASAAYATIMSASKNNPKGQLQVGYMAPTEILAKQHFASFINYFAHTGVSVGLITSAGCSKFPSKIDATKHTPISRTQLLKWVASGEISILIGTHALIQKSVRFRDLGLVVIDEQHRFGINQRLQLAQKHTHQKVISDQASGIRERSWMRKFASADASRLMPDALNPVPHLLSMTATPIPRTLALTIYGDLDLTLLDEMPAGRKPIITKVIVPALRAATYAEIRTRLSEGRQLYVICPRIDEPDPDQEMALNLKSAKTEAKRLKEREFPEFKIDIVHSKLKTKEKDAVMQRFADGDTNILVATSVVEVGVNVPNATMIIIEGAERFGLAQLHQLRGRVQRSNHQAYCYIFSESKSAATLARLRALKQAKNGFELAEQDMQLRGAGELSGKKQWGISDIGMEALKNIKMVEAARAEARRLLEQEPKLDAYPLLKSAVLASGIKNHFE